MKKDLDNGTNNGPENVDTGQVAAAAGAANTGASLDHEHSDGIVGHVHRRMPVDRSNIPGWGTDLERPRPRNMQPEDPQPIVAPQPVPEQPRNVEILCSTERPGITPLFGTSVPPAGLSGALRRMAYKQSENDLRRWLTLLLADRVNVIEGIGADLSEGKVPNIFQEMGVRAEWQHNRAGLVRKTAVAAVFVGLAIYLKRRR